MMGDAEKWFRMVSIFQRLTRGEVVRKKEEVARFKVSEKTIQRDLEDMKYLWECSEEISVYGQLGYDRSKKGYCVKEDSGFTKQEILSLGKILLESRAFQKDELSSILEKLLMLCSEDSRKEIASLIASEKLHYVPIKISKNLFETYTSLTDRLWDFTKSLREQRVVEVSYIKANTVEPVLRKIEPVGLIFAEYYFYVVAYLEGKSYDFPAIYRLDRIKHYRITNETFRIKYTHRFEEGEFRKRVQFMKPGELMTIQFEFWGNSIDAVLDRLPTAKIIKSDDNIVTFEAEVFGNGVKMWLLSQAQYLKVIKPEKLREEMKDTINQMLSLYEDTR